jgi:hypothetical protein
MVGPHSWWTPSYLHPTKVAFSNYYIISFTQNKTRQGIRTGTGPERPEEKKG